MSGPTKTLEGGPPQWRGFRSLTKLAGQLVVQRCSKRFRRSVDARKHDRRVGYAVMFGLTVPGYARNATAVVYSAVSTRGLVHSLA